MIIVAVITLIIPVILIIPTLMQVDLQGQPRAGTVVANPVEEADYRRFQLSPPSSSQLIPIRYQYYTRLQNQSGVNLDVLVSITHCQTVTIVIIVLLLIIVLILIIVLSLIIASLLIIVLLLIIAEHPRARDSSLLLPNSVPRCLACRWQTEQHSHHVTVITIIVTIINTVTIIATNINTVIIIVVVVVIITILLNVNINMPINVSCIRKALSLMAT